MAKKRKDKFTVQGGQLLTRGDIIRIMDEGQLVKCRVLSCLMGEGGSCRASLEILDGERQGRTIHATLKAACGASEEDSTPGVG